MSPAPIKSSTQQHLDIEDIRQNLIILKDASCCMILETTAINFSLLSEGEQDATIYAYAGLLNSLTFPIQIIIRSQRKNISSYLALLAAQEAKTQNTKLKTQLQQYRQFISKTVHENEVLDKKFYIVIPFSSLELGIKSTLSSTVKRKPGLPFDKEYIIQRAQTALIPKRDHLLSQLTKIGLKAKQLATPDLIKLLYHYYNPDAGSVDFDTQSSYQAPLVQAAISGDQKTSTPPTKPQPQPSSPSKPLKPKP